MKTLLLTIVILFGMIGVATADNFVIHYNDGHPPLTVLHHGDMKISKKLCIELHTLQIMMEPLLTKRQVSKMTCHNKNGYLIWESGQPSIKAVLRKMGY